MVSACLQWYLFNNENFLNRWRLKYLVNELYVDMIASRSKRVNLPVIRKAKTEPFFHLELPTNGKV